MIDLPKEICSVEDAEKFAEILVWDFGMAFQSEETYMTRNESGIKVKRLSHLFSECSRSNALFENGYDDSKKIKPIKKLVKQCYGICDMNDVHFADILCYVAAQKEDSSIPATISGEEEVEECNRQFYGMIYGNDAWGNLD